MPWFLSVLLTVFAPLVLFNFYVGRKIAGALSHWRSWRRRNVLWVVHGLQVVLNILPVASIITFWVSGRGGMRAFNGDSLLVDLLLVYPFWTALIITIQLTVVFLLWDTVRIIGIRLGSGDRQRWDRRNRAIVLLGACLLSVYSVTAVVAETFFPRVLRHDIPIPERFSELDGLTILQISDVQGDGRTTTERVDHFVRLANELRPDIIVNCGDFVTSGDEYIDQTVRSLAKLEPRLEVLAVVGDHDIFSGHKQRVLSAVRTAGHTMLEDTSIFRSYGNATLGFTFVTYTYPEKPEPGELETIMALPDTVYRILLVHQPAMPLVQKASTRGYDLLLAGHTHGGGVAFGLPVLGYVAPATFETRYVSGLYSLDRMYVSVTNGLGFTLAPIRFNAPIELVLLTLRSRKETDGGGT